MSRESTSLPLMIQFSRRHFLGTTALASAGFIVRTQGAETAEPIIDIHQHLNYSGRSDEQFFAHQAAMGVTMTVLLPAGRPMKQASTHDGNSNGLAAEITGNEPAFALAAKHPDKLRCFANEVADLADAVKSIRPYLKRGGIGIGEQKFGVEADSPAIEAIAGLAAEFNVPVLLHFQHGMYNLGIDRFHKILGKFPKANFIGHAQTWWGNIDKLHKQEALYPQGPVTPGGITDRLLSDYPNMFGDLSAGSGLNALVRDEDHTRAFLERHQDKLIFGSDCNDTLGRGPGCQGAQTIATLRRLAPSKDIERKLLYGNASKLLRIS